MRRKHKRSWSTKHKKIKEVFEKLAFKVDSALDFRNQFKVGQTFYNGLGQDFQVSSVTPCNVFLKRQTDSVPNKFNAVKFNNDGIFFKTLKAYKSFAKFHLKEEIEQEKDEINDHLEEIEDCKDRITDSRRTILNFKKKIKELK